MQTVAELVEGALEFESLNRTNRQNAHLNLGFVEGLSSKVLTPRLAAIPTTFEAALSFFKRDATLEAAAAPPFSEEERPLAALLPRCYRGRRHNPP